MSDDLMFIKLHLQSALYRHDYRLLPPLNAIEVIWSVHQNIPYEISPLDLVSYHLLRTELQDLGLGMVDYVQNPVPKTVSLI